MSAEAVLEGKATSLAMQDEAAANPKPTSFKALTTVSASILVGTSVLMTVSFVLLRVYFGYPDIIREAPGVILSRLHEMRHLAPYLYYSGVGAGGLCAFFVSLFLYKIFLRAGDDLWSYLAKYCGMACGITFYAGILRWTFLFPLLAKYRVEGTYNQSTIDLVFDAFNTYVGDTFAEHVGFTFLAPWALFISLAILRTKLLSRWLAYFGVVLSAVIIYGNLEFFGAPGAFIANREGTDLAGIFLLALGVNLFLIRNKKLAARPCAGEA